MNAKKRPDSTPLLPALLFACLFAVPANLRAEAETLHYQGRLTVGAAAHNGSAYFKFALYDPAAARVVWSNDGTTGGGSPAAAINLTVHNGLFSVSLGSPPMPPIGSDLFADAPLVLRIWADTGSGMVLLAPDQKLEPVAIAHRAETVPSGSITANELAASAVTGVKLSDGAVTAEKLAGNAVTGSHIADGTITGSKIAGGTISGGHIAGSAITGSHIAANAITGGDIAAGTVTGSDIAANAITGGHIAANAITGSDIAAGAITNSDISAAAAIAASKISDGSGSGLDADYLDGVHSGGFLRSDADSTFTGGRLTVQNDLRLPSLTTLSFEDGSSSIAGFIGSIAITTAGNGDILLTPGDEVAIDGDASIDGSTLSVDSSNHAVGFGTGAPESRLHVRDPDLSDSALFERNGQTANQPASALRVRTTKTSAFGAGFGTGIDFEVDSSGSAQPLTVGRIRSRIFSGFIADLGGLEFDVYSPFASPPMVTAATLTPSSFDLGTGSLYAGHLNLSSTGRLVYLKRDGDGELMGFYNGSTKAGSISLSGSVVSYNAFTGSHYAHTPDQIGSGLLVTMTGDNRFIDADKEGEPHYGIKACSEENSQAVLGAYGGQPTEPGDEAAVQTSLEHPHLVNAVGNAHVWIADTGADIKPGDYLISSAVPGHARLDPRTAPESHIIGRAAETVVWGQVADTTAGGIRHAKITILFDSFARYNPPELRSRLADQSAVK